MSWLGLLEEKELRLEPELSEEEERQQKQKKREEARKRRELEEAIKKRGPPLKRWTMGKPKFPAIEPRKQQMENATELTKLPCGCECEECKSNYLSYWEEKTYAQELKKALFQEQLAMKEIFTDIRAMERDYEKQVVDARVALEASVSKVTLLQETLEAERTFRAEVTYQGEVQKEETKSLFDEQKRVEAQLVQADQELFDARLEISKLRESSMAAQKLKDKVIVQLRAYETQINTLERENAEMRVRLYTTEISEAKTRMKNEALRAKIKDDPGQYGTWGTQSKPAADIHALKVVDGSKKAQASRMSMISRSANVPNNGLSQVSSISLFTKR